MKASTDDLAACLEAMVIEQLPEGTDREDKADNESTLYISPCMSS